MLVAPARSGFVRGATRGAKYKPRGRGLGRRNPLTFIFSPPTCTNNLFMSKSLQTFVGKKSFIAKLAVFLSKLVSTGLFIGKIKYAPGTFGSALGILIGYLLLHLPAPLQSLTLILSLTIGSLFVKVYLIATKQQKVDPKEVVFDEIFAVMLICFVAQFITKEIDFAKYLSIFGLFRIFDILKPYPICVVDKKMKNTTGIMLDDILAALASILVYIVIYA
jgi:phosphatidylglycerophosphatase A